CARRGVRSRRARPAARDASRVRGTSTGTSSADDPHTSAGESGRRGRAGVSAGEGGVGSRARVGETGAVTTWDLADLLARLRTDDPGPAREDAPVAVDAADRLLLDEAAPWLRGVGPGAVSVVDDRYGALTLGAALLAGAAADDATRAPAGAQKDGAAGAPQRSARVHQAACTSAPATDANAASTRITRASPQH